MVQIATLDISVVDTKSCRRVISPKSILCQKIIQDMNLAMLSTKCRIIQKSTSKNVTIEQRAKRVVADVKFSLRHNTDNINPRDRIRVSTKLAEIEDLMLCCLKLHEETDDVVSCTTSLLSSLVVTDRDLKTAAMEKVLNQLYSYERNVLQLYLLLDERTREFLMMLEYCNGFEIVRTLSQINMELF